VAVRGAVGFVSVIGHVVADRLRAMIDAFEAGQNDRARTINASMLPVVRAMGRVGGVVFAKSALRLRGLDVGDPRLPLPPATEAELAAIVADLDAAGVALDPAARAGRRTGGHGALGARADVDLGAEVAYR
jgi:4-hydroxy-tetrahydrodipicolinate synthase